MSFRLLDTHGDLATGMKVEGDGSITVRTYQDVEPVVEHNKVRQTDGSNGYGKSRELRHLATIPDNVVMKWLMDAHVAPGVYMRWKKRERMAFYRKHLNNPDWQYLRSIPGRV